MRRLRVETGAGRFFVIQPGLWDSDIAWISVDEDANYDVFVDMFRRSGVAQQMDSVVDCIDKLQVYSAYYVVRSKGKGTNYHADFVDAIGCNAFTLMTPLADYAAADFQLLYRDLDGATRQHRYRRGEALCFGSDFVHSTQPGRALEGVDGGIHVYLCFTFGTDKTEYWKDIYATQGSYASRVVRRPDGRPVLTELGKMLEQVETTRRKGYHRGHCLAGDDIHVAVMTLEEAIEWSSKNPQCVGFTYGSDERDLSGPTRIWFKSKLNVVYNEKWWTYSTGLGTPIPIYHDSAATVVSCFFLAAFADTLPCPCAQAWTRRSCVAVECSQQSFKSWCGRRRIRQSRKKLEGRTTAGQASEARGAGGFVDAADKAR